MCLVKKTDICYNKHRKERDTMKTFVKSLSVILAAVSACNCIPTMLLSAAEMQTADLNYTESTEYDLGSCDSGYTSCPWIRAAPGKDWSTSITRYSLLLISVAGYSSAMNESGTDYDFDEAFFTSLENTLKSAQENGVTVGIRFRYDENGIEKPEPADFEQVLRHVEQIGESGLLTKYQESISFIETGFVGCWGEQWGGKYTSLTHKAQLLNAFMKITPLSIPLLVRTPNTVRQWLLDYCGVETTAADMTYTIADESLAAQAARVGLYNDGYMGSDYDLGTYQNRPGETAWLHTAPSYGGEFSGNDEYRLKYPNWQPENAIAEMYYTQLMRINSNIYRTRTVSKDYASHEEAQTRLNEIDSLYESAGLGSYDYSGTITQNEDGTYKASWKWMGYDDFVFDEELDEKLGVDCDNSAFYGENTWQFIRAHLGYRFVLRNSTMNISADPGGEFNMEFSVENTGFSETPKDKEAEIILTDGDIKYTYTTEINPRNWESASFNTEKLSLTLPKTLHGGKWDVYLRISEKNSNAADDTKYDTRFANNDLIYSEELGANYMGSVTVSGDADPEIVPASDTKPSGYYPQLNAFTVNEENTIQLLDRPYEYKEDGHFGFTFLYKAEGITEALRLGNLYINFTVNNAGYSSAYTTYGLNTMNLELTEDGYYALYIPFYGCAFNCTEASSAKTSINALNINDSRNYWSEDTYTVLGGNTNVKLTPVAFVEGALTGYEVTFHLPDGDAVYTGEYGFENKLSQSIRNKTAVSALSLLDKEYTKEYTDNNGNVYTFLGFTTREGDKSCIIEDDFIAAGNLHLYPYYELNKEATNLNTLVYELVNGADSQGVRYVLDESTMTASVGDGSLWGNNSGYSEKGSIIIPGYVTSNGKTYKVTSVSSNAFGSNMDVMDVTIPATVTVIGENPFYADTKIIAYKGSTAAQLIEKGYDVTLIEGISLTGDVNLDFEVSLSDAVLLQKHIVGSAVLTNEQLMQGDIDKNNRVNVFDLVRLKAILCKNPVDL